MLVSWNWLQDFVDLTDLTPEVVAEKLTMSGMEVEGLHRVGSELDGVVLGHVVECAPHPGADSLSLTKVDIGAEELVQVVCGAPNVAQGAYAPLATVGTTIPSGITLKKAKIRGEKSFGMLCSESELGLPESVDGLLLFDAPSHAPGTPIATVLGLEDTVIEIGLTPNRPDGLSIRGVAREVAALFGRTLRAPEPADISASVSGAAAADAVRVTIADPAGCPRYAAAVVRGVKVGPSPDWLRERIEAVGQRSVNNLVDVTNYILMEQGQPLHAFDLAKVRGGEIRVRRAEEGETITSLDGSERPLLAGDLVIADAEGPTAIAGVMGGADSEITDATTDVLIECANFEPSTVRRTSRRLGMHTESSHRFERGVDVERIPDVLARTLELIVATQEHLGVKCAVAPGPVDVYPSPYQAPTITMDAAMPERILGVAISPQEGVAILTRLGITAELSGGDIVATIPAYRPDLERPIDLVEEVGRVHGYEAIPSTPLRGDVGLVHNRRTDAAPRAQEAQPVVPADELDRYERLRRTWASLGVSEAVNWSFSDPEKQQIFAGDSPVIRLRNPLGAERAEMRRSLLPGLLENMAHNLANGAGVVQLIELGRVYPGGDVPDENAEPTRMAGVFAGDFPATWNGPGRALDAYDVTGSLRRSLNAVGVDVEVVTAAPPAWAHPGVSASVKLNGRTAGWLGRLHPEVVDRWQIEVPVYAFDVAVDEALARTPDAPQHAAIARTPASDRDLALVIDTELPYGEVHKALRGFSHKLLESVTLFDVYAGKGLPDGKKSIALRAVFRDREGTLTDGQVDKLTAKLLRHLERSVGATLRA